MCVVKHPDQSAESSTFTVCADMALKTAEISLACCTYQASLSQRKRHPDDVVGRINHTGQCGSMASDEPYVRSY